VLGCTEYELVAEQIREAIPGAVTFGSAAPVAAQALRRIPAASAVACNGSGELRPGTIRDAAMELASQAAFSEPAVEPAGGRTGTVRVLLSGRPSGLPQAALCYPEGRLLAPLVVVDDEQEPASSPVTGR
jgi:glutamate racemase